MIYNDYEIYHRKSSDIPSPRPGLHVFTMLAILFWAKIRTPKIRTPDVRLICDPDSCHPPSYVHGPVGRGSLPSPPNLLPFGAASLATWSA